MLFWSCCFGLDLKRAFDTVSHTQLLNRLQAIGVGGKLLEFFKNCFQGRVQVVKIGDLMSSGETVTCGIPQGACVGPNLFIVYV